MVDCPPLPSPTAADNIVTWDRAVLMAAMIAWFEVDFVWLLQEVMHETHNYLPFPVHDLFSLHARRCAYMAR